MRKKKIPDPMVGMTVIVPSEQRRRLRLVAQEMNVNMAEITREAHDMFLEQYGKIKRMNRKGRR